jgi:hypothetical protein
VHPYRAETRSPSGGQKHAFWHATRVSPGQTMH